MGKQYLWDQTTQKVRMARDKMQASQSRQKAYADRRRRPLEFATEDHVFLRILRRIGPVAYEIALPPQLANLHPVFHVSQLRKYVFDLTHVLEVEDIQIKEDLTVEVPPIALDDSKVEECRGKIVSLVKVI
ncbi:uncharacterized protein LOC114165202 [Vigna unguiculata]|uniref:uncharacterized protein LOC114165202 n=1 Tax=Vigna unguiculata TaxID=3917 RepID=UPI0010171E5E|nr:uncharacterized protein LOC114165202 [Vigna unguiculata]